VSRIRSRRAGATLGSATTQNLSPRDVAVSHPRLSLHPLTRAGRALLGSLVLLAAESGAQPTASPPGGGIEGIARGDADAAGPVPYALVRLLAADADAPVAQTVTGAAGRFRFADVPAGRYRLQLVRIGYRPVVSPALDAPALAVGAGQTLTYEMRVAAQPVALAAVTVAGNAACLTGDRVAADPVLGTVWQQARDGVELRRAFERQYRFVRLRHQDVTIRRRLGGPAHEIRDDTLVSHPDSAEARDTRRRLERQQRGYRTGNLFSVPEEKDLVDPEFLRTHCLDGELAQADGLIGLRFRPVTPRRDGEDVRGTVWLDTASYLARRLDVEWLRGTTRTAAARLDYTDVPVAGGALRLPGDVALTVERVSGAGRALVRDASARVTVTYRDIAPAR